MVSTPGDTDSFLLLVTTVGLAIWRPHALFTILLHKALSWSALCLSAVFILGGMFAKFWDKSMSWLLLWALMAFAAALVATIRSPSIPTPEWLDKLL